LAQTSFFPDVLPIWSPVTSHPDEQIIGVSAQLEGRKATTSQKRITAAYFVLLRRT
jgi:hypothetical protein